MSISFSNALGIHEQALNVRTKRAEVLANNLANADTPGFKARDIDFKAALAQANQATQGQVQMETTRDDHIQGHAPGGGSLELLYRTPLQPSLDGNTVDSQMELTAYMRNAMDFQSSFQFLNSKFKGLSAAIKGE